MLTIFYFHFPRFLVFSFWMWISSKNRVNSYGMDDGQMNHMNPMGIQLSDNIDFNLDNIDMYTSSFN